MAKVSGSSEVITRDGRGKAETRERTPWEAVTDCNCGDECPGPRETELVCRKTSPTVLSPQIYEARGPPETVLHCTGLRG